LLRGFQKNGGYPKMKRPLSWENGPRKYLRKPIGPC
jgi:hypothetical protein